MGLGPGLGLGSRFAHLGSGSGFGFGFGSRRRCTHSIPLRSRAADVRDVLVGDRVGAALQRPREVDLVLTDDETDERRHRYATVLDLRLPEPGDRRAAALGQRRDADVLETGLSDAEPG